MCIAGKIYGRAGGTGRKLFGYAESPKSWSGKNRLDFRYAGIKGIRLKEKHFQLLILSPPERTWGIKM